MTVKCLLSGVFTGLGQLLSSVAGGWGLCFKVNFNVLAGAAARLHRLTFSCREKRGRRVNTTAWSGSYLNEWSQNERRELIWEGKLLKELAGSLEQSEALGALTPHRKMGQREAVWAFRRRVFWSLNSLVSQSSCSPQLRTGCWDK